MRRPIARSTSTRPNDLGFLELQIFPNRIDAGIIEAIDVALSYDDGATFQRADTFRVLPTSAPQFWRLRLTQPARRDVAGDLHASPASNGATRTTGPISSDASVLPVDDPFEGALDIRAIPLFPPDTVRQVFVDVTYEDEANNYRREERLEIPGNATDAGAAAHRAARSGASHVPAPGHDRDDRRPPDPTGARSTAEETLIGVGQADLTRELDELAERSRARCPTNCRRCCGAARATAAGRRWSSAGAV